MRSHKLVKLCQNQSNAEFALKHVNTKLKPQNRQIDGYLAVLLVVGFGAVSMLPALIWGIPSGADLDNHYRFAMPFFDEVASGNFVPGWLAESNNGFGDARFRFYPPLLYYVLAAARFATGEWYFATLLAFTLFAIIGALGVYAWARQSFSRPVAVCSALLFALMPYHLTQFYQASLLAEFASIALLPFAFVFVERLTVGRATRRELVFSVAGIGVSFGMIILTHLPTMIVSSLSLGLFAVLAVDWKRNKRGLIFAAMGIGLALLLSSFFWVKMLSELPWIQGQPAVMPAHYDYRNNFLFSPFSLVNLNTWYGGLVAALTVAMFIPAVVVVRRIFRHKPDDGSLAPYLSGEPGVVKRRLAVSVIVALAAFLMTTDLSRPLWSIVPGLKEIQFPFRWLTVVSVLICPVVALSLSVWLERIRQKNIRARHLPILLAFVSSIFVSTYELAINNDFKPRQEFVEHIQSVRGGPSFALWLPPRAAELKDLKPMTGPIDPNGREVLSTQSQSHHRRFTLAAGPETQIRIRTYYYPLWQATITTANGRFRTQTNQAEDGTLLVTVPAESCEVSVDFVAP